MSDSETYLSAARASAMQRYLGSESDTVIERVAIIGAGIMGAGIATACVNAGLEVVLVDRDQTWLDRGLNSIKKSLERSVEKNLLSAQDAANRLARIVTAADIASIHEADVVIEAVWEKLSLKQSIFEEIDKYARAGVLLGSNTSTLNINEIASVTSRPNDVIGLHFFSPAHVMKLMEVVRGGMTSDASVARASSFARILGKVAVVVGVCEGFVGNRIFAAREYQAQRLLLAGALPEQIDRVLVEFGFPMGSFELADMTGGIEIMWHMRQAKGEKEPVGDCLMALGRLGQKTGKGYYRYDAGSHKPESDPEVAAIIEQASREAGIARSHLSDQALCEQLIYPMINEGARILEEGIADCPSDIDVIWSLGYGWPKASGGPMHYADSVGLQTIVQRLSGMAATLGPAFEPSPLLRSMVQEGRRFSDMIS